jgi:uncharacterized membrane protein SirB2
MMATVKIIHVVCALLSISGFVGRGILMIKESVLLRARWLRITPHVVDTLLLVSAIVLASQWGLAAFDMPWLWAKVIALLLYIALGVVALRAGRTKAVRVSAWAAAIVVFAYIVSVAISKNPLVFS